MHWRGSSNTNNHRRAGAFRIETFTKVKVPRDRVIKLSLCLSYTSPDNHSTKIVAVVSAIQAMVNISSSGDGSVIGQTYPAVLVLAPATCEEIINK